MGGFGRKIKVSAVMGDMLRRGSRLLSGEGIGLGGGAGGDKDGGGAGGGGGGRDGGGELSKWPRLPGQQEASNSSSGISSVRDSLLLSVDPAAATAELGDAVGGFFGTLVNGGGGGGSGGGGESGGGGGGGGGSEARKGVKPDDAWKTLAVHGYPEVVLLFCCLLGWVSILSLASSLDCLLLFVRLFSRLSFSPSHCTPVHALPPPPSLSSAGRRRARSGAAHPPPAGRLSGLRSGGAFEQLKLPLFRGLQRGPLLGGGGSGVHPFHGKPPRGNHKSGAQQQQRQVTSACLKRPSAFRKAQPASTAKTRRAPAV